MRRVEFSAISHVSLSVWSLVKLAYFFDLVTFLLHKSNSSIFGKHDLCSKKVVNSEFLLALNLLLIMANL